MPKLQRGLQKRRLPGVICRPDLFYVRLDEPFQGRAVHDPTRSSNCFSAASQSLCMRSENTAHKLRQYKRSAYPGPP